MNEPDPLDWDALKVLLAQGIRDNLIDGRTVDDAAEELRQIVERWGRDRDLFHYEPDPLDQPTPSGATDLG